MQDKGTAKRSLDKPDSDSFSKRMCLDERGTPPQNDDGGCVITGASGPIFIMCIIPGMLPFKDTDVVCSICSMSEL